MDLGSTTPPERECSIYSIESPQFPSVGVPIQPMATDGKSTIESQQMDKLTEDRSAPDTQQLCGRFKMWLAKGAGDMAT